MQIPKFQFSHIGINPEHEKDYEDSIEMLSTLFNLSLKTIPISTFVGEKIEILKTKGLGEKGHLAFYTEDIQMAMEYLQNKGYSFMLETAKYKEDGQTLRLIYLKEQMLGYAIHLTTTV